MMRLVSQVHCRCIETSSILVRGTTGPSAGRNVGSKPAEEGSIPSGPANGEFVQREDAASARRKHEFDSRTLHEWVARPKGGRCSRTAESEFESRAIHNGLVHGDAAWSCKPRFPARLRTGPPGSPDWPYWQGTVSKRVFGLSGCRGSGEPHLPMSAGAAPPLVSGSSGFESPRGLRRGSGFTAWSCVARYTGVRWRHRERRCSRRQATPMPFEASWRCPRFVSE